LFKKRFIGVITVKDRLAVQSIAFKKYLPIGDPVILAENLDRWGVDEILVISIDRTSKNLGPDLNLLENLSSKGLSTPLTFGGGINCLEHAIAVIKLGAERICVDSLLKRSPDVVKKISNHIGAQAIIASLPVCMKDGELNWYNHVQKTLGPITKAVTELFKGGYLSEALIIDYHNDGSSGDFNLDILSNLSLPNIPVVPFGGITEMEKVLKILGMQNIIGFGVGNSLSYTEHAVQKFRERLDQNCLRVAQYSSMNDYNYDSFPS